MYVCVCVSEEPPARPQSLINGEAEPYHSVHPIQAQQSCTATSVNAKSSMCVCVWYKGRKSAVMFRFVVGLWLRRQTPNSYHFLARLANPAMVVHISSEIV